MTLFGPRDRADEARAALMRSAALLEPGAPGLPLLDFRRGLVAEKLGDDATAARASYLRAHAGAEAHGDALLTSFTWGHLAGLAARDGDLAAARHGFAESLRLRVETGYVIGAAPALAALATVEPDPEGGPAARRGRAVVPAARRRTRVARGDPGRRGARVGAGRSGPSAGGHSASRASGALVGAGEPSRGSAVMPTAPADRGSPVSRTVPARCPGPSSPAYRMAPSRLYQIW